MSNNKNFNEATSKVIDLLVDSTLKKHDVELDGKKIDDKTKEELRDLVKDLQKSVQSLTKKNEKESE